MPFMTCKDISLDQLDLVTGGGTLTPDLQDPQNWGQHLGTGFDGNSYDLDQNGGLLAHPYDPSTGGYGAGTPSDYPGPFEDDGMHG